MEATCDHLIVLESSVKSRKTISTYPVQVHILSGQEGYIPIFTDTPEHKRSSC